MRWSITLGTIAGTAVRVHLTFLLFLLFIGISEYSAGGPKAAWDTIVFITLIFTCVVLHEFGHILMARRFGVHTRDVTLFPIGGIANMERIPEKPSQELAVALAGPAVNLVIGVAILAVLGVMLTSEDLSHINDLQTNLALRIAAANIILLVFNLIPAFPMDGGRVLRALLAMKVGYVQATRIAASIGQGFAFILGFLGFMGNPMLIFIAIFVYIAAAAEAESAALRDIVRDLTVGDAMITTISTLSRDALIGDAVDQLLGTALEDFPVVDNEGRVVGLLTRGDIVAALHEKGSGWPISRIMKEAEPLLTTSDRLDRALGLFETAQRSVLIVSDAQGRIAGLLTHQAINHLTLIRTARPDWDFHRRHPINIRIKGLHPR